MANCLSVHQILFNSIALYKKRKMSVQPILDIRNIVHVVVFKNEDNPSSEWYGMIYCH